MKILNGAHVERDISVDQFEGIVGTSGLTITSPLLKMRCLQKEDALQLCIYPSGA